MIPTIELILVLLLAVAGLAVLARKLRIAYPILFVLGGLVLGFVPGLPRLRMNPDLIFVLFLPPLLYPAAFTTPWRDFHVNIGPILRLAIGLVLLSTVVVAWFAHQFIGLPLAAGFVLGAIISPPDAVAATAVTQTLRVPRRIVTILDGESLVNDATAFTAYKFAVAAMLTGVFSLQAASFQFVLVVLGGTAAGLIAGWLIAFVQKRLDDPSVQTTLSLLTPYATYLFAERVGGSGVLAVVVCGLYVGWKGPEVLTSRMRLVAVSVWGMIVFILNGFLFILIGLQLPDVVKNLSGRTLGQAIWQSALIVGLLIVVRIVWFLGSTAVAKAMKADVRCRQARPSWRHMVLMSWAGMRGVDSLAAALALPFVTADNQPLPQRGFIVFVTFSAILATLVLQGLTLPLLIRMLNIVDDHSLEDEEREARLKANQAALKKLGEVSKNRRLDEGMLERLRGEYEERIQQLSGTDGDGDHKKLSVYSEDFETLSREILGEERKVIVTLRNDRVISDQVLRRIQRDLDLAEARLDREEAT
jgi:CPA1 family monovalent cation:H+ antiporter